MAWKIVLKDECWDYWQALVDVAPGEVGCWGYVTLDTENHEAYVDTLFIVPQEASAAEVDFIERGLPYAIEKAAADERLDDLKFCIHSHGTFGAFWSTTDEDMIAKMGLTSDWFVSAITNKKGDTNGRIDLYNLPPLHSTISLHPLPVVSDRSITAELDAKEDFKNFVFKPAPKVTPLSKYDPKRIGSKSTAPTSPPPTQTFKGSDGVSRVTNLTFDKMTDADLDAFGLFRLHADGVTYIVDGDTGDVLDETLVSGGFGLGAAAWDDEWLESWESLTEDEKEQVLEACF